MAISAFICGVILPWTAVRHSLNKARGCSGHLSSESAITVSASGPRVGLTRILLRSPAVK